MRSLSPIPSVQLTSHKLFEGAAFAAFLFDMDGTLLSSVAAAERVWTQWALRHGLDVASFLPTIHGVRSADTIRGLGLPGVDADAEAEAITQAEIRDLRGVVPIQGAVDFTAQLPSGRWAIVTSAPRALARARLKAAGLQEPPVMIAADDVSRGKPDPEGYRLAATRLGFKVEDCLIFEDAAAGIAAAERAPAPVLVITETHSHAKPSSHASSRNYESLRVMVDAHGALLLTQS